MSCDLQNQNLIGIFTTDAEFVIQIWDAALERMTGIAAASALGKRVVEIIPNLAERGLLPRFERVLNQGTTEILAPAFHRFLILCEPRAAAKHFREMRQRVTIAPLKENETVRGLIVTIEDVTARMERELDLAAQLKNPDDNVRLQAAKAISDEPDELEEASAAPLIDALGDKNWRVRRELIEGLSRRAAPDAVAALLLAVRERHLDFAVLNSALQVLQATSVETTETLVEFLRGADADLRMQSALALGEQKNARAIPFLLDALRDENVNVRYHAIEALGKLKTRAAVEPLLEIAETRDFFLSFAALDALRQIADESTANRIGLLLNDDFLREAAAETLGEIGNEESATAFVESINDDKSFIFNACEALDKIYRRGENGEIIVKRARQTIGETGKSNLLEALAAPGSDKFISVVRVAGWFDDERIRRRLSELVERENIREEVLDALVRQGEKVVEIFIEKLESDNSSVAQAVALALGRIGDARAFEPLLSRLKNGDGVSRQAAAAALKTLAHPETVNRLCNLLTNSDSRVREAAINVVGHFGAKGCENVIFECCEAADERVRKAAVEQLFRVDDARVVSILIRVLKRDESARVRAAAAQALGQIAGGEKSLIVAALRAALADADAWTRYFAVRSLGVLRDEESREILTEIAENDAAQQVRAAAKEVLNELKA